jgi:hypothetical protein
VVREIFEWKELIKVWTWRYPNRCWAQIKVDIGFEKKMLSPNTE